MSLYNVEIIEKLSRVVEQEADSYEDAVEIDADEEIVLDWNDLNYTNYEPYPSQELAEGFEINVKFDLKNHIVNFSDEYELLSTYDCKTMEDLNVALNDFFGDYPELEEIKTKERNMEV